jgi:hypothetical protein
MNRADLALAAARTRILAERLGDADRDALIAERADLLDRLEECEGPGAAVWRCLCSEP